MLGHVRDCKDQWLTQKGTETMFLVYVMLAMAYKLRFLDWKSTKIQDACSVRIVVTIENNTKVIGAFEAVKKKSKNKVGWRLR